MPVQNLFYNIKKKKSEQDRSTWTFIEYALKRNKITFPVNLTFIKQRETLVYCCRVNFL